MREIVTRTLLFAEPRAGMVADMRTSTSLVGLLSGSAAPVDTRSAVDLVGGVLTLPCLQGLTRLAFEVLKAPAVGGLAA